MDVMIPADTGPWRFRDEYYLRAIRGITLADRMWNSQVRNLYQISSDIDSHGLDTSDMHNTYIRTLWSFRE